VLNDEAILTLISLCLFTAGPTDRAVQKLAYGRHRNEWGTNIFLIKHIDTFCIIALHIVFCDLCGIYLIHYSFLRLKWSFPWSLQVGT